MTRKAWTSFEHARVEQCVLAEKSAWECLDQFPGRTVDSLIARFKALRAKHGLPPPNTRTPASITAVKDPLLKRQLETGQHFIRDRAAFVSACASVGIAA